MAALVQMHGHVGPKCLFGPIYFRDFGLTLFKIQPGPCSRPVAFASPPVGGPVPSHGLAVRLRPSSLVPTKKPESAAWRGWQRRMWRPPRSSAPTAASAPPTSFHPPRSAGAPLTPLRRLASPPPLIESDGNVCVRACVSNSTGPGKDRGGGAQLPRLARLPLLSGHLRPPPGTAASSKPKSPHFLLAVVVYPCG